MFKISTDIIDNDFLCKLIEADVYKDRSWVSVINICEITSTKIGYKISYEYSNGFDNAIEPYAKLQKDSYLANHRKEIRRSTEVNDYINSCIKSDKRNKKLDKIGL